MKIKYRIHPVFGFFQSTRVTEESLDAELEADGWRDEMPEGFIEGGVSGDGCVAATVASINSVVPGDTMGG